MNETTKTFSILDPDTVFTLVNNTTNSLSYHEIVWVGVGFLAVLWLSTFILIWAGDRVWAWIDEKRPSRHHKLVSFIMCNILGHYESNHQSGRYEKDNKYGTDDFSIIIPLSVGVLFLIGITLSFLTISLVVYSLIALAFATRSGRRLQKKVKAHIENTNIHKKEK